MAASKNPAKPFARLLDAIQSPVYLLDSARAIVACNAACLAWTGVAADDLLGQICNFHSAGSLSSAESVAAGLCPPPEVFQGQASAGEVTAGFSADALRRRQARFVPLEADDLGWIVLAVVEATDPLAPCAPHAKLPADEESPQLHLELQRLHHAWRGWHRVDRLIGKSPAMHRVRAQVMLAAQSTASVLIVGPPGSGRQHVARIIHYGRADHTPGRLAPLACSLLSAELLRSQFAELVKPSDGQAERGVDTMILCDVDQLPAEAFGDLAACLARLPPGLRAIATAAAPLEGRVATGNFPPALAAELSTLSIELPALAARREDLPLLAQGLLEEMNSLGGKQLTGFSPEALDRLAAYPWPGNAAEMAETIAAAHTTADGPLVEAGDLPPVLSLSEAARRRPRRVDQTIALDQFLADIERELIQRALARGKGNKAKAARLLGLTRPRLYRRMVNLGLIAPPELPDFRPAPEGE